MVLIVLTPTDIPKLIKCEGCGWVGYEDSVDFIEDYYEGVVGYLCPACGSKKISPVSELDLINFQ